MLNYDVSVINYVLAWNWFKCEWGLDYIVFGI
jgi:hypothetical protein